MNVSVLAESMPRDTEPATTQQPTTVTFFCTTVSPIPEPRMASSPNSCFSLGRSSYWYDYRCPATCLSARAPYLPPACHRSWFAPTHPLALGTRGSSPAHPAGWVCPLPAGRHCCLVPVFVSHPSTIKWPHEKALCGFILMFVLMGVSRASRVVMIIAILAKNLPFRSSTLKKRM